MGIGTTKGDASRLGNFRIRCALGDRLLIPTFEGGFPLCAHGVPQSRQDGGRGHEGENMILVGSYGEIDLFDVRTGSLGLLGALHR